MTSALPPLVQESGVPFDLFIQSLTDQLDKAQASMALKARVGKLPITFAVKEVSIDLRAFVNLVQDEIYLRPAGPGDAEASTVKLSLTTITKPMIEENAVDFRAEDPRFSLREALGDKLTADDQRSLERIGVRTVTQLTELRKTAGADVVARLARMPVNRLQQALLAAAAPRVSTAPQPSAREDGESNGEIATRLQIQTPLLAGGRLPRMRAAGLEVPVVESHDGHVVVAPLAVQMGREAELDFGDGEVALVHLRAGCLGSWRDPDAAGREGRTP